MIFKKMKMKRIVNSKNLKKILQCHDRQERESEVDQELSNSLLAAINACDSEQLVEAVTKLSSVKENLGSETTPASLRPVTQVPGSETMKVVLDNLFKQERNDLALKLVDIVAICSERIKLSYLNRLLSLRRQNVNEVMKIISVIKEIDTQLLLNIYSFLYCNSENLRDPYRTRQQRDLNKNTRMGYTYDAGNAYWRFQKMRIWTLQQKL